MEGNMKKLLSALLAMATITGIVPTIAGADSEPIFIEKGVESWSDTRILGDINCDDKLSIADAVILQRCLMGTYDFSSDDKTNFQEYNLDINFDGYFDVFDLVQMRQNLLNPENVSTQNYYIDIVDSLIDDMESIKDTNGYSKILTSYSELSDYLTSIITDNSVIQKYLDRYNEAFFEENNLIIEPFIQQFGEGIFSEILGSARLNNPKTNESVIVFEIESSYQNDEGLYPQNNTKILAQATIPKSQCNSYDLAGYINLNHFMSEQKESCYYTSEDGSHEIVITQEQSLMDCNATVYLKNSDSSFTYLTDVPIDDVSCVFVNDGELSTDNYTIQFNDDSIIIDWYFGNGVNRKKQVSYDGTLISETSYEK